MKRSVVIFGAVGVVLFVLGHMSYALYRLRALGAICIVIAVVILVVQLTRQSSKSKKLTQSEDALTAKGYKYVAAGADGSSIGLDALRRMLFLQDASKRSKEYAFDDVRSWRINCQETGKVEFVPGGNFQQQMATMGMQHRANREAARIDRESNGLFIRVKDIDTPEWHIGLQSQAEQTRWHEILTQYINEGAA